MEEFKVGDKVFLREDSKFNDGRKDNPLEVEGVIVKISGDEWISVDWSNVEYNSYRKEDLVLSDTDSKANSNCSKEEFKNVAVSLHEYGEKISEEMFNAVKRVVGAEGEYVGSSYFSDPNSDELYHNGVDWVLGYFGLGAKSPCEILGEPLYNAIKAGYTPWFEGDDIPEGYGKMYYKEGSSTTISFFDSAFNGAIAYKKKSVETNDADQSIESRILADKVGNKKHSHYFKDVSSLEYIDVYRVLKLFNVTDPCVQHAIKKQLCSGGRGVKDVEKDLQEAIDSLNRALEMMREDKQ